MFWFVSRIVVYFLLAYQSVADTTDVIVPEIDLSEYGKAVITGDFSGISFYAYNKRGKLLSASNTYNNELFIQGSNGILTSLGIINGIINVMITIKNGNDVYIVIGGEFSRIGDTKTSNILLYSLHRSTFITLKKGIPNGVVKSLYYDEINKHIYVGGKFHYNNSLNAIVWDLHKSTWIELPFQGFNGIVNSISRGSNQNILFGGDFENTISHIGDTLSAFSKCKRQVLNLQTAWISSEHSSSNEKYSNPRNIICPDVYKDKSSWILADAKIGKWIAIFQYVFRPKKIRFKNSDVSNYGTKTFRLISLPINGIMNFSYIDPVTKKQAFCEASCPLQQDFLDYQEFDFVNVIPMIGFRIEIMEWYGKGGGLKEIEVLLNDIETHALNMFNEPYCVSRDLRSNSYVTGGPWKMVRANGESYLSTNLSGLALENSSVTFEPRIQQGGYYYIQLYTPGCIPDNTCSLRGMVILEIYYQENTEPKTTVVYQNQNYGKIDVIYEGYIYPISPSFKPRVVLTPVKGQHRNLNVVALRIRFVPISFFITLNGIYEYNPSKYSAQTPDQRTVNSSIDILRSLLPHDAVISSIIHDSSQTIIAGRFFSKGDIAFSNILQITHHVSSLAYGGVNGEIFSMLLYNRILYIGGKFDKVVGSSSSAINNVVSYSINDNSWISLLWGLNGVVYNIFKYRASINGTYKFYIAFSGDFTQILSFNNEKLSDVNGFALWDPDNKKWIIDIDLYVDGQITNSIMALDSVSLTSGNIRALHSLTAFGAVFLDSSKHVHSLYPLSFSKSFKSSFNSLSKRNINKFSKIKNSVYTGIFYKLLSQSLIILGGQFITRNYENKLIKNIAIVNDSEVTGIDIDLDPSSIILSIIVHKNILYAGGYLWGKINGDNINGIFMYDFKKKKSYQTFQLPGKDVQVNSLSMRPKSDQLIVAGKFDMAGLLPCNGFCIFETSSQKWKSPSVGFSGQITSLAWFDENSLLLSGIINLNGTLLNLVKYHFDTSTWSTVLSKGISLPGPAFSILLDKNHQNSIYLTGKKEDGHIYFNKWNGSTLLHLDSELLLGSIITHLRVIPLKHKHRPNNIIPEDVMILALGSLVFSFGNVTGAFYDGNDWIPYLISSTSTGEPGMASSLFFEHEIYPSSRKYLAKGFVVLISLSISLFIIFLMTLYRVIISKYRKKKGILQTSYFPKDIKLHEASPIGIPNESNVGNL
ncbi:uncharacterized protein T551_02837 [Pneumocystis jirovecii RU7]|uniref:Uncharacterized protein n=1 Tax=Pneumocystis jirovecii (strain RU7) TaxID=1408657 RepID=A0A0W4ZHM6_PNEJ7|nr:uncharacterized protein T551_02837 [Pneumocystis jirovecii RU7]KTW27870.1 hypothetical protein T551_02837 [Pneumocystis jirovecii RU7]